MGLRLEELSGSDRPALIKAWLFHFEHPPPSNTSQDMMRLIIGWELQAQKARSDIRDLNAALRSLGKQESGNGSAQTIQGKTMLSGGTRLSRDWQGRTYVVDVLDKGFAYDGKLFTSLTPIAKTITGAHRSGPHFFGVSR